jgi:hypothetical protein
MDDQTLSQALSLILNRIEEIQRDAEDASQQAFATRSALAATLKEYDPQLEDRFQAWITHFQPHISRHGADSKLQEIRSLLASFLSK